MATSEEYGLGEFAFPRGWFMVAEAHEATQKPASLRYFGEDLVMYRGDSGKVYVTEAYCPHLGAHLAKNETSYVVMEGRHVEGESIRCPYHGWRFNGEDGQCNDIPYSPAPIPKKACLKTFPTKEWGGLIFVWYDAEGNEPDYDLVDLPQWEDDQWIKWKVDYMGQVNLHPIEILDNMVDRGHFEPIHGSENIEFFENEFKGPRLWQRFKSGHKTLTDDLLYTDTWYTGPGLLMSKMDGYFDSLMFIANTQVENGVTKAWHGLMVKTPSAHPAPAEEVEGAKQFQVMSHAAFSQDFDVWANKRACFQPLQVVGDGPFGKLRAWAKQFYNPRKDAAAVHKKVDGVHVVRGTGRDPWDVEAAE